MGHARISIRRLPKVLVKGNDGRLSKCGDINIDYYASFGVYVGKVGKVSTIYYPHQHTYMESNKTTQEISDIGILYKSSPHQPGSLDDDNDDGDNGDNDADDNDDDVDSSKIYYTKTGSDRDASCQFESNPEVECRNSRFTELLLVMSWGDGEYINLMLFIEHIRLTWTLGACIHITRAGTHKKGTHTKKADTPIPFLVNK
ncbi:hypothetical protein V8F20_003775 [Naviculisporaceae sp. PSN 640]